MKTRGRFQNWWYWVAAIGVEAGVVYISGAGARSNWPFGDQAPAAFDRVEVVLLVVGVAVLTAAVILWATRYAGMNEVYGATATDAATPRAEQSGVHPPTRFVSDRELATLATTTFAPPHGIAPWQGHALLRDEVNRRTSDSFVAGLIAADALRIDESTPGQALLVPGPQIANVDRFERGWLTRLLGADDVVTLYEFDTDYASGMEELTPALRQQLLRSGWWRDGLGPALVTSNITAANKWGRRLFFFILGLVGIPQVVLLTGAMPSPLATALWTMAVSAVATFAVIIPSWPSRTAEGSAYALQVESFRRFLEGSESARVEHAWKTRNAREYAAWAIAIDNADAWRPEIALAQTSPQSNLGAFYTMPSFRAAFSAARPSATGQ